MSAYQKSTLILRVEPWTLCSEADKESEHTEGEISRREDFMTRCDRHVLSLPAKTASHEIRDFVRRFRGISVSNAKFYRLRSSEHSPT